MKEFDALLQVAEKLLGPEGCPWDIKQTFSSLQPYVLEEAHEVIEAVDANDDSKIVEELGDLLYTIVFYAKLAEKTSRFSMKEIVETIEEKLIRRHPHIFSDVKVEDADDVVKNWEKIKAAEKKDAKPASKLDGLPPTLPALVRAQKILKRIHRAKASLLPKTAPARSEEEIGDKILELVLSAEMGEIDAESALRRALSKVESVFRKQEITPSE